MAYKHQIMFIGVRQRHNHIGASACAEDQDAVMIFGGDGLRLFRRTGRFQGEHLQREIGFRHHGVQFSLNFDAFRLSVRFGDKTAPGTPGGRIPIRGDGIG
ncbi:MAG: hypothetical protein BWX80_03334 [Candidatus Hydrogenedentes bacterium ADurb.Bin101]|nr:MAG: hypothetical protein BWX80_03334 [Candidatus Hydrogenedentes bacterium ADurb.Bin101]